jgi:hypothetical protein
VCLACCLQRPVECTSHTAVALPRNAQSAEHLTGTKRVRDALQVLTAAKMTPPHPKPRPPPAPKKAPPSVLAIVARRNDMNMLESFIQVCYDGARCFIHICRDGAQWLGTDTCAAAAARRHQLASPRASPLLRRRGPLPAPPRRMNAAAAAPRHTSLPADRWPDQHFPDHDRRKGPPDAAGAHRCARALTLASRCPCP